MLQKTGILLIIMVVAFVGPALAATDVVVGNASGAYGTTVDVPINVSSTSNIGAMDISLTYSPAVIRPTGIVNTGSLTTGLLVINDDTLTDDDDFSDESYNQTVRDYGALANDTTATSGVVNVSIISRYGITGTGPIAVIRFQVVGSGDATSPLTLSKTDAYDLDSPIYNETCNCTVFEELLVTSTDGTFTATGEVALTADINGDDTVNYKDLGMLGLSYGLSVGDTDYDADADLNDDDTVNYKDLGLLGLHYGESV